MSIFFDPARFGLYGTPRGRLATTPQSEGLVHDAVVVVLADETLAATLEELRSRLSGMLEQGPSRLVLDLSRVSRLSSTTIATLLWTKRTCASRSVEVVVRRPSRGSVRVLHRTGLLTNPCPTGEATAPDNDATRTAHEVTRP